jgi:hypothetical protein
MDRVVSLASTIRSGIQSGVRFGINAEVATIAATLDTTDLSTPVATDGTDWAAVLTWHEIGPGGNAGVLHLAFIDGDPSGVEVRDGEMNVEGIWVAAPGTIGVLANGTNGIDVPTIGEIEAAINAGSDLAQVTTADPSPSKEVDMSTMEGVVATASFSGGA